MRIIGFCDKDTAVALRLAGVKDLVTPIEGEEIKQWNKLIERENLGLILITEELADKLGRRLREYRYTHRLPIIVEIPDKRGRRREHIDIVSQLIKKAVGVEIT